MIKGELTELLKIRNLCYALSNRYKESVENIKLATETDEDLDYHMIAIDLRDLLDLTDLITQARERFKTYINDIEIPDNNELFISTLHAMEFDILSPAVENSLDRNKNMFKDMLNSINENLKNLDEEDLS